MSVIMKREVKNFLKRPLFWIGVLLVALGVFREVRSYLGISYVSSDEDLSFDTPSTIDDADITDGYVPTKEEDRRKMWEEEIRKNLVSEFEMGQEEAEAVIEEMKEMDIQEACEHLKTKYHYYGAIYTYEDMEFHQGTAEEVNSYIGDKLSVHRFSYYFSRKFADFSGLYMGFFAAVMFAALFWQDTRKNTYELLHTKPVRAGSYVLGKIAGGTNAEGIYGYYGRPLVIMVRFPGRFFDTAEPPMALLNQCFLILAATGIILICIQLWKRRRM